jgi:hypothetical protein
MTAVPLRTTPPHGSCDFGRRPPTPFSVLIDAAHARTTAGEIVYD